MNFTGPNFVLALIAISTLGWVLTSWIRAKHGYPMTDDWGGTISRDDADAGRKIDLLSAENERLVGQVGRLEERIAVLERIVTDPAERVTREIDLLRNR